MPGKCKDELSLLFDKQGKGSGVAVQEILFTDGADLAVAKKSGQAQRTKMVLHQAGIVARTAEKIFPATGAAKKAATVNRRAG